MRENKPVLLVLSVCAGEIILEKGEILCEKRHFAGWFKSFLFEKAICDKRHIIIKKLRHSVITFTTVACQGLHPYTRFNPEKLGVVLLGEAVSIPAHIYTFPKAPTSLPTIDRLQPEMTLNSLLKWP